MLKQHATRKPRQRTTDSGGEQCRPRAQNYSISCPRGPTFTQGLNVHGMGGCVWPSGDWPNSCECLTRQTKTDNHSSSRMWLYVQCVLLLSLCPLRASFVGQPIRTAVCAETTSGVAANCAPTCRRSSSADIAVLHFAIALVWLLPELKHPCSHWHGTRKFAATDTM